MKIYLNMLAFVRELEEVEVCKKQFHGSLIAFKNDKIKIFQWIRYFSIFLNYKYFLKEMVNGLCFALEQVNKRL